MEDSYSAVLFLLRSAGSQTLQESKTERKGSLTGGCVRRTGGPWSTEGPANTHLQEKHLLELCGSLTLIAGVASAETLARTACAYMGHLISLCSRTRCARAGQETRTIQTGHIAHLTESILKARTAQQKCCVKPGLAALGSSCSTLGNFCCPKYRILPLLPDTDAESQFVPSQSSSQFQPP